MKALTLAVFCTLLLGGCVDSLDKNPFTVIDTTKTDTTKTDTTKTDTTKTDTTKTDTTKTDTTKTDTTKTDTTKTDTTKTDTTKTDTTKTPVTVTVDAVTSASKKHKILQSTAWSDSVLVNFWFFYSNGTVTLCLRDKSTQTAVSSIVLTGVYKNNSNQKLTVKNLAPAKTYELYLKALYSGKTITTPVSTFTTPNR